MRSHRLAAAILHLSMLMPEAAIVLGLLAAVWFGVVAFFDWDRREEEASALAEARRMTLAFRESIARRTDDIDNTLRLLRSARAAGSAEAVLAAMARAGADGPVFQVAYIAADGRLSSSNLEPVASKIDLSDREHFRIHADNPERDELFVSLPLVGRASGKTSIQFSRRVGDIEGRFDGVMVASLSPSVLTELHGAMGDARGTLSLYGTDGRLRARSAIGHKPFPTALDRRLAVVAAAAANGDLLPDPAEPSMVIGAYARVPGRPLVLTVTFDLSDTLVRSEARHRLGIEAAATVSLIIIAGGAALGRRRLRLVRSRQEIDRSRQTLEAAVEGVSQGIVKFDLNGRVEFANHRAAEILGIPWQIFTARPQLTDLMLAQHQSGEFGSRFQDTASFLSVAPEEWSDTNRHHVYERVRADGTVLEVRTHPLPTGGAVRTYTDVTERRAAEDRARYYALHDPLTGLPNRVQLAQRLDNVARLNDCFAVLVLDLDRFKPVNDFYGHHTGDQLLRAIAARLRNELRHGDVLARIGGDEFALLLPGASAPVATAFAQRVVDVVSSAFEVDDLVHSIGATVGVAVYPLHGLTGTQLLMAADIAMYSAKRAGKGTWALYDDVLGKAAAAQISLERDVETALAENQFTLAFQPICDAFNCKILGFEALIRWKHPTRGIVPPSVFVPAAERSGLIVKIGHWVLEAACAEAARWPGEARIAVNFSPPQFMQPDLCEQVHAVLDRTGLPASRLEIEVTEGLALGDADIVLDNLQGLRRMGAQISLDDFGTGNSSLSYLCRFPFDKLKIDRSFVLNLGEDGESNAIVSSILSLGRSLKLTVVAEGVETEIQLQELRAMHCDQVQGYLLGKPLPPEETRAILGGSARTGLAA